MAQERYAEAEPLYQRAIAIREKTPWPDHRHLMKTLEAAAELYRKTGPGNLLQRNWMTGLR